MFYQEVDDTRTSRRFYLVMVKSVLLFGPESWVITPCILRDLIISQNWVERSTYIHIFWCRNRKWE